ncbi:MAG: BamA/TamA family outer membrane protein [Candidatus Cloacimonetes bacterium]|nr:BamA/TamA family outer membrane protein [Candidatus Cloacimonadota bacterium]
MTVEKIAILLIFLWLVSFLSAETDLFVREVIFTGNSLIPNRELQGTILTQSGNYYSPQTAQEDCIRIANFYHSRGFLNIRVYYPEAIPISARQLDVHFIIEEGELFQIEEIVLKGNSYFSAERIAQLTGISLTGNYPFSVINNLLFQIVDLYASRGFLFARAELKDIVVENDKVKTFITIDEGRFARFEQFVFEGNDTTRESTLLRISGVNQMETFSFYSLHQAEENVRRKEYIRDFSLIPVNHQTLLFRVEEDRMTKISGILGYDSSQEQSGSRITGFVNLKFLNLYGTDRDLVFSWRRLRSDRQSIEFRYHESGPFALPIAGDFLIFRETVDSTYIKTTFDSEVYYYTLRNKYGVYLGSDDFFPGTRRPKLVEKSSQKKIGAFWHYNSEDFYLNPTKGMRLEIKHYYIFKKDEGNWIDRQATEVKWNNYITLTPRVVLMSSLNGKQVQNRNLKDYELYDLGGTNDLRGFREKQFSGYRVGWSNLELRYLLTRKSRVFLFTDYGIVQYPVQETTRTLKDLIGVGFGMRIDTRLGLIGVDYGISHSEGKWLHPLDGMIHFGLETGL